MSTGSRLIVLLLLATLGGCDPRDCSLGISYEHCYPQGSALAEFPQDDAVCRDYGLAPGTHDYDICRRSKRHVRALSDRATDFGVLQDPLLPNTAVVAPVPPAPR